MVDSISELILRCLSDLPKGTFESCILNAMEKQPRLSESIETREYTPSDEALGKFLNLSTESLDSFKDRLAGAQGHLRIWVHPLYTEQWPGTTEGILGDADLAGVQKKLRETFFKTTDSVVRNQDSSPLIVYEAVKKIEETKGLIAENLGCEPTELEELGIVFVPTDASSSFPDTEHLVEALQAGDQSDNNKADTLTSFRESVNAYITLSKQHRTAIHQAIPGLADDPFYRVTDEERRLCLDILEQQNEEMKPVMQAYREAKEGGYLEGTDFMVSLYKSLGLKSALVSGAYLQASKNYKTKEPELKACAGKVVSYLRGAEFPTDISNNIWPPKELVREAGFEVKQTGKAPVSD